MMRVEGGAVQDAGCRMQDKGSMLNSKCEGYTWMGGFKVGDRVRLHIVFDMLMIIEMSS